MLTDSDSRGGQARRTPRGWAFLTCAGLALVAVGGCAGQGAEGKNMGGSWAHHEALRVVARAKADAARFPVSLDLDAKALAEAGKLRADAGDLRIAVAGEEVPFQLEQLPGGKLRVTFQVDVASGDAREDVVLSYGNPRATMPDYASDWARVSPEQGSFANGLIRVSYALETDPSGKSSVRLTEFTDARRDENQLAPAAGGAGAAALFAVEADGPVYKRVRFISSRDGQPYPGAPRTVTFYKGCAFVREDYSGLDRPVLVEARPGGTDVRTDGERNFDFAGGLFDSSEIAWDAVSDEAGTRVAFTADRRLAETDERYKYLRQYEYNGRAILGVYNVHNGRGVGVCADGVRTARLVDSPDGWAGVSLEPRGAGRLTRYVYAVGSGTRQIVGMGKLLAAPPAVSLVPQAPAPADHAGKWCRIATYTDSAGGVGVVLENAKIFVRYETSIPETMLETFIREFILKANDANQGHWLDAASWRSALLKAEIVADEPARKTVRLTWEGSTIAGNFRGPAISEVTICADDPALRIDYLRPAFAHICDLGSPGGKTRGEFAIYAAAEWQKQRQAIVNDEARNHPNEHHRLTDDLLPMYPFPLIAPEWGPTALSYNGWYVMCAYDPATGQGYGRVTAADAVRYVKLLGGASMPGTGFEFFPHWQERWAPFTSYLFAGAGGPDALIAQGKAIADELIGLRTADATGFRRVAPADSR